MIDKLYGKYFQKSRSFLYPMLGIKRSSYISPSGTYISLEGKIEAEDIRLICTFKDDNSEGFKSFENQMLLTNPLFVEKIRVNEFNLYVFDLEIYQDDYFNFLLGRYSKFSAHLKRAIKNYYGEKSAEYQIIETYLYPEKYFDVYAKLLDVDVNLIKKIGELCDPYNHKKENLKIPIKDLENLNKIL
jgi:hypothetical protein